MTDELPLEFLPLNARRILWEEYGVVLPGFSGDDAIDALRLHALENRRREVENRKMNNRLTQNG